LTIPVSPQEEGALSLYAADSCQKSWLAEDGLALGEIWLRAYCDWKGLEIARLDFLLYIKFLLYEQIICSESNF
jgi:hypothetical protein